jgi:hypothetical protein
MSVSELVSRDKELKAKQMMIDQLTHEMATLKRYRFDQRSGQIDPSDPTGCLLARQGRVSVPRTS